MKRLLIALAFVPIGICGALTLSDPARADVLGSLGAMPGSVLTLSSAGLNGGAVATLTGGTLYTNDQPFADIPKGGILGSFLAVGPASGNLATLSFVTPGINRLSFLWGSPDTYNALSITSTKGAFAFSTASLGFSVSNGDQSFSQYVQFATEAGESILSARFTNAPFINAFEVANFRAEALATPGPVAGAGLIPLLGLAGAWYARRRKQLAA
jgi:hypothetical protein